MGRPSWFLAYTESGKYGMWLDHLRKACEILGDNITVNYSNNGWGGQQYALQYTYNMADFCNNNRWGYSVQSWWWQEKDAQLFPNGKTADTRWYSDAYFDMPAELMAAFTLETFRRGGDLVQYEPRSTLLTSTIPDQRRKIASASMSRRPIIRAA